MKEQSLPISVQSEIGVLDAVLLHTPGTEVENMTPRMAQRATTIVRLSFPTERVMVSSLMPVMVP